MQTIIELYDERPIENVLGAEVFRPKELVILCPAEVESTNVLAKSLRKYFEHRGCPQSAGCPEGRETAPPCDRVP